jgi:hypothetical protein
VTDLWRSPFRSEDSVVVVEDRPSNEVADCPAAFWIDYLGFLSRSGKGMDIGKPRRTVTVEPVEPVEDLHPARRKHRRFGGQTIG